MFAGHVGAALVIGRAVRRSIWTALRAAAIVVCLLGGCVTHPGPVSESLAGRVVDADTGEAIAGAHLYLAESPKEQVVSSEDGGFTLAAMRKWQTVLMGVELNGERMLVVEAPDYPKQTQAVNFSDPKGLVIRLRKTTR
jgi:hypothetical protein